MSFLKYFIYIFAMVSIYVFINNALKNQKYKAKVKKIWKKILNFFAPSDMSEQLSKLRQDSFDALNDESTISQLLMYSHYVQEKEGEDEFGVYTLRTDRQGFIIEISPPPFLGEETERTIESILSSLQMDDLVVNFFSYAPPNIGDKLENYKTIHTCDLKIKNTDVLKGIVHDRVNTFEKYSKKSMLGEDGDFRLRNFHNLISVVFPQDIELSTIKACYMNLKGSLHSMHPKNFRADKFLAMLHDILKPGEDLLSTEVDLYRRMNV